MSYQLVPPDEAAIRAAISVHLPRLASKPIEPLGAGWAFWAYRVGDSVLRFPRDSEFTRTLATEAAVMRELAPTLPLPVTVIEVHDGGPNDLPFTSHAYAPGVQVRHLPGPLAPNAGEVLGRFLRAMHSFPMSRAVELGLPYQSPQERRAGRQQTFEEQVRPKVFPLISEAAQSDITSRFEAYLGDDANFAYQPVVSHGDLDDWNTLADPATGAFTGVVDWGDIEITDPAGDFTISLYGGFRTKGIDLTQLAHAYGMTGAELEAMRPRCAFSAYCWPLHEIIYGLESHQEDVLQKGLEFLYDTVGR